MSGISDKIAALTPEKRALLDRRLALKRAVEPVRPRPAGEPCPVSHAQQLMWLMNQLVAQPSVYNVNIFLRLQGELNEMALGRTLEALLERHEALRTRIVRAADGAPMAVVDRPQLVLPVQSVSGSDSAGREEEIRRLCLEEARNRFDFATEIPFRARLLRVDAFDHVLLMETNHMVFDGWSRKILLRDFGTLYNAFSRGEVNPLAPLPLQYGDFAAWQRARVTSDRVQQDLAYWKRQLSGAPQVLELPADRPRPAEQSFRGARITSHALPGFLDRLRPVWTAEQATRFMTVLAAFNLLLYRYTGQTDILVGTPVLGRGRPEIESLIGCFSNTLVIRTDLSGDPTFRELLRRVRATVLEAMEHDEVALEVVIAELHPERNLARSPLFQVMLTTTEERAVPPRLSGLDASLIRVDRGVSRLDLTLGLSETEPMIEYSSDLFDASTITRMLGHFETILNSAANDPDASVSSLNLVDPAERSGLLGLGTGAPAARPAALFVHAIFERQAAMTPDAPAVEYGGQALSYRELNERANRIAHYLAARPPTPGSLVGLYGGRSLDFAAGLLGILKAGAACVPLDPSDPWDRLRPALRQAGMRVILTAAPLASAVRHPELDVVCLNTQWAEIARYPSHNPLPPPGNDIAACVIFTSGTTGQPKGVLLSHRGLTNHQLFAARHYGLGPGDRVLQFSRVSFDIALEEIFPAWAGGATVVLRPEELQLGTSGFLNWVERHRITVLDLPTAFWNELANGLNGHPLPPALRLVVVGGEAVQTQTLIDWYRKTGGRVRWLNTYGPTETSVIVTVHEPAGPPEDPRIRIPIGRPIENTQIYILDARLAPVPVGIPGELCVAGEGLALGYLNEPDLSARKFVPNPFLPGRLYRTGDQARWLPNGEIEFLGRLDRQVKVRGYRVEPGEIEAALVQSPAVSEAAVVYRAERQQLAAYVVPTGGESVELSAMKAFLKERLPEYMIPVSIATVARLPRTPRGKLDLAALPDAGPGTSKPAPGCVAPRDDFEQRLAALWEKVLGVPGIGIRDNFFDLGGHSLLAVSLAAQIENALGRPVPLPMLLRAQTIEALAAALRGSGDRDRLTGLLKLGADDRQRLTPASSQSWCALEYVPPRSEVERRLAELWSGTLGVPNCGIRDNFFEVGGNSRLARELLGRIEKAFGRKLTFAAFLQSPTIQSLAATLGQPEHCQVVPIQPEGSYPPLFVVRPLPLFRLLADRLGFQQPVLGLALPEGADDVCEIARNLVAVLRTRQPAGPYRLAGWCANGVVAYEMAQQLRSAGESVNLLVLFDTFNPASAPSLSPLQTLQREGRRYLADGRYHWETLRMIGPAEAPAYLGRRAVALVRGVSSGLTRRLWKSTPEKKAARRGYWRPTGIRLRTQSYPVAPYPGRVLLFSAVRSHARHFTDPSCGWSKLLGENLTVVNVPGDHLSMFLEPTVSTVAGELAAHLNAGRR